MNDAALITGSSRGIGSAIAEKLSESGMYIYINYLHSRTQAEATLQNIMALGGKGEIFQASIAQESDVAKMFDYIKTQNKRLTVLVNNASITKDSLFGMMSSQDWNDVIKTNLNGLYLCTQQAIKIMIAQKFGSVVNISSVSGQRGAIGQTNYSAAKAAVIAFTKSLAMEVGKFNIRINCVAPGYIDTDMLLTLPLQKRKQLAQSCSLGRIGTADEVASLVRFLISDQASYIQGQTITIDGGMY
jgi:3-oxoacyl-[acyl-carrier protein] reductase